MTTADIIDQLSQEKSFGSRFPARIIFVDDLSAYNSLVSKLKGVCDVTVNISQFSKSEDLAPQFDKLCENISHYADKHVLLLSVGEYLRLCIKREILPDRCQFRGFWELMQPETSKTRFIIPVFRARDLFDRIIGKVDERQEDFLWTLDSHTTTKRCALTVYSPQFNGTINPDACNFKSWLDNWPVILGKDRVCTIITRQYKYVEDSLGAVSIKTIDTPFSYVQDTLGDVSAFQLDWLPEKFWAELAGQVKSGARFSDIVLKVLNVNEFDFVSVAARWNTLPEYSRALVWLWYRAYPSEDYYSHACKKAQAPKEIPEKIRDEILRMSTRCEEWVAQRSEAVKAFNFDGFNDSYFDLLDTIPMAELKFQMLTYRTHEERTFAIKAVSSLLRNGVEPDAAAELIKPGFPILAEYLATNSGINSKVDEYFAWYRKNKIINRFPGSPCITIPFDKFDSRLKHLNKLQGKDCFTLWIDGFGMEWLPVFLHELEKLNITPESKEIATAILPTETEYNHQWATDDLMSEKWMRLDSLSHKGMPDDKSYFSCIDYQLSVFSEVAKHVDELLDKHEYVAITGDHGSSRMAALAFHDSSIVPITAPKKAMVRSFGRFCELSEGTDNFMCFPGMEAVMRNGSIKYIVMNDYQHFSVSGNAAGGNTDNDDIVGEVHGGNTPEERLIPVVIVKRSRPLPPLTCISPKYVTKKNGRVETNLKFNRPVSSLEVTVGGNPAECAVNSDGSWHITISSIPEEELRLSVVANGRVISDEVVMKIKTLGLAKNSNMLEL